MSRVGKIPVTVPAGVEVLVAGQEVKAKSKGGQAAIALHRDIEVGMSEGKVWVKPRNAQRQTRAHWGTARALVQRMLDGLAKPYSVGLEIVGIGFRAAVEGKTLKIQLGYSHDVVYPIPPDVAIRCDKPTSITVSGIDKQRVGQVAAQLRAYRPPEPYKGKGVKYERETVLRKEGKKK